jgi:hypothetical protein
MKGNVHDQKAVVIVWLRRLHVPCLHRRACRSDRELQSGHLAAPGKSRAPATGCSIAGILAGMRRTATFAVFCCVIGRRSFSAVHLPQLICPVGRPCPSPSGSCPESSDQGCPVRWSGWSKQAGHCRSAANSGPARWGAWPRSAASRCSGRTRPRQSRERRPTAAIPRAPLR